MAVEPVKRTYIDNDFVRIGAKYEKTDNGLLVRAVNVDGKKTGKRVCMSEVTNPASGTMFFVNLMYEEDLVLQLGQSYPDNVTVWVPEFKRDGLRVLKEHLGYVGHAVAMASMYIPRADEPKHYNPFYFKNVKSAKQVLKLANECVSKGDIRSR